MDFWNSVGSFCSNVGRGIGKICSSIGGAVSSFASGVGTVIGSIVTAVSPMLGTLGRIATGLMRAFGVLNQDEDVEKVGDKALQAAESDITMDKFENFDEYMQKLRDFQPDEEKSKKLTSAEKLTEGIGVGTAGLEKKLGKEAGSLNEIWALPLANPDYFNVDRLKTIISAGRLGGNIFDYLEKKLSGADMLEVEQSLEFNTEDLPMTKEERAELYTELEKAQNTWGDYKNEIKK